MKSTQNQNKSEPNILELGSRSLNKQHTNRTLVIPKIAMSICGYRGDGKMSADVKLIINPDGEKFIKITPIISKENKG